jgi:hypothetical protein
MQLATGAGLHRPRACSMVPIGIIGIGRCSQSDETTRVKDCVRRLRAQTRCVRCRVCQAGHVAALAGRKKCPELRSRGGWVEWQRDHCQTTASLSRNMNMCLGHLIARPVIVQNLVHRIRIQAFNGSVFSRNNLATFEVLGQMRPELPAHIWYCM